MLIAVYIDQIIKIDHQPTFHHSLHTVLPHTLHSHSTGVRKCPFIIFDDFEHHLQVFVQLGHLPTPALYGQLPIYKKNKTKTKIQWPYDQSHDFGTW